jgi:hypothetical protein
MDILNNCLTILPMLDSLISLSSSLVAVRFDSRKKRDATQARLIVDCVIKCKNNLWWTLFGESQDSQGSLALSVNPNNVHRPIFDRIKRCSPTFKRDYTMPQNNSVQQTNTQAQAEQHHPNIIADNMARPLLSEWVSGNQEGD